MENNDIKPEPDTVSADGSLADDRCKYLIAKIKGEDEKVERKGFGFPRTMEEKASLSKAAIAMANTLGGYIILGVADDGESLGISDKKLDPANLNNMVSSFVIPEIRNITCRVYEEKGKRYGVIFIPPSDNVPHITIRDSAKKIFKDTIYVRHSGQSERANFKDLQRIIFKACITKQKELVKHLEESDIQRDIRLIKEFLLGKDKRLDVESIILEDKDSYIERIDYLLVDGRIPELKKIIKLLRKAAVKYWKDTKEKEKQKVLEIKELYFIPILNKLTYLAYLIIENNLESGLLNDVLEGMKSIYELSNNRNLGCPEIDTWIYDQNKEPIKARDHLNYTVPEKEVYKRVISVGAFLTKMKKFNYVVKLCNLEVNVKRQRKEYFEQLLFYPIFDFNSGEGTASSIFDEITEFTTQDKFIFDFFDKETEECLDNIIRADFLIDLIFFLQNKKRHYSVRFKNFTRFYVHRLNGLFEILKLNRMGDEFPKYSEEKLREYLSQAINFANKVNFISDWATSNTGEFF